MSLTPVYQKLVKISATASTNDKVTLLKEFLKDDLFIRVIKFALSGDMKFHIQQLPKYRPSSLKKSTTEIFAHLTQLAKQSGASNSDKTELAKLASIDSGTFEVVKRIITKDLKCGVNAKLINKALPGTVNIVPYMRCSTDKKIGNIVYEAIIQEKADGMFVNVMINKKGQIKIITRNGKTVHQLGHLKRIIFEGRGLPPKTTKNGRVKLSTKYGILNAGRFKEQLLDMVYTGELLVIKRDKILPRKTGNGILNSCIAGTASPADAKCVVLRVWDCLPLSSFYNGYCEVVYNSRIHNVHMFVRYVNDPKFVNMVMSKRVKSYEEAHDFYSEIRKAGGEGAILKNLDSPWKDHTSPNQVKLKNVSEAELEIIGWDYGKDGSKYELCMGSIQCVSRCGNLKVNVGSGFQDEEREADWDMAIGSIVTVEFESVIQDKSRKEIHSLFLPRFKEIREDRDVADSLEEIQKR